MAAAGAGDEPIGNRPPHDQTELCAFIKVLRCVDTLTRGVNPARIAGANFDTDSEDGNDTVSEEEED